MMRSQNQQVEKSRRWANGEEFLSQDHKLWMPHGNREVREQAVKSGCGSYQGNTKKMAKKVLLERPERTGPEKQRQQLEIHRTPQGMDKGPASTHRDRPDQPQERSEVEP